MACTLLRIVQAAVSLRRRFECAIQSSFESVESGEILEDQAALGDTEENEGHPPCEEDVTTSEHLSQNFQLSFEDEPEGAVGPLPFLDSIDTTTDIDKDMTFLDSDKPNDSEDSGDIGAYRDAKTSSSIDILKENVYENEETESGSGSDSPTIENESLTENETSIENDASTENDTSTENESPTKTDKETENDTSSGQKPRAVSLEKMTSGSKENNRELPSVIHKLPTVQVNEASGSDKSSSDSDTDSRCSIKSVRLRYADTVSPSSGCKPAKIIKSDPDPTAVEAEVDQQWILLVKESGHQLVKENDPESSNGDSDVDKNVLLAYSDWLVKGQESAETDTSSSDENDILLSPSKFQIFLDDDEDCDSYFEDEDEVMVDASFEDSFVDDGFVSLDVDEYDDDVIIEENESDLEKERLEEEMLEEMRRSFEEGTGRTDTQEHRKLSRQYSPAIYLADPLPGIPETKVVIEAEKEGTGRLRYSSSYRSVKGSKKSLRSPPVQRQRCVQLEGVEVDDEGAGGRPPRPSNQTSDHRVDPRDIAFEVDPIRVTTNSPSSEVPLVVVATAEGGTRTHALHLLKGRSSHQPSYSHSASSSSSGDPLPKTHTYHKYASASFDLAKSNRHEGARAAFHTSRSSFEGDRRLSLSATRGACESIGLTPSAATVAFDKSPGSGRHLPSMEGGSRPCSSGSNSDRTQQEGLPLRSGFRRSKSERVGGSPHSVSPARSDSLRVGRTRSHPQDVEMTELCSPRRLLSPYDDYRLDSRSSRISPETSPTIVASSGESTTVLSSPRYASWRYVSGSLRRQSSLESGELEDLMENRRHVEQRRLRLQADSTTPSDEDEEPRSKIRYNDMGSLEQVNEEMADLLDDSSVASSSDNHEKIKVQCRALWQLRATLEEEDPEEPDSDSGRMDILSSPEHHSPGQSPDQEIVTSATSHTTSFESNTDAVIGGGEPSASEGQGEDDPEVESANESICTSQPPITLPSSEVRRTSYRAILANRLKQIDASNRPPLSSENSFDSVDTECSSTTDLSRPEALTTSFDSTTDCPTDSTSDTHSHRLQQMKADSGYRSLEANNGRPPKLSKKQINFMEDSLEVSETLIERDRSRERPIDLGGSSELLDEPVDTQSKRERIRKSVAQFERRTSKSLAKKRREALRERHASLDTALSVGLGSSLMEGDATPSDEISGKRSVLAKFLRTHRYPAAHYRLLQRDYSIDEKSDRLFKEFSRTEVPQEWEPPTRRGSRLYTGRRLHRHLDADGSPRSHRRKLSPQDSIEEEDQMAAALWDSEISRPESIGDSIGLPEEVE